MRDSISLSPILSVQDIARAAALLYRTLTSAIFWRFVLAAAFFVLVHLAVASRPWELEVEWTAYFRLDRDRSVSEWFEYALLLTASLAAFSISRGHGAIAYRLLFVLFAFLLIDNSMRIHENIGQWLSEDRPHLAEMAFNLGVGAIFGLWGLFALARSDTPARALLIASGTILVAIAIFGIAVDTVHGRYFPNGRIHSILVIVEDGGEMIGVAYLCAMVLVARRAFREVGIAPS